ncbi:hypothetical protein [Neoasaia chiangmaiensis]|nr:hypothetical protein [Neoasaia chiangmaiensis]
MPVTDSRHIVAAVFPATMMEGMMKHIVYGVVGIGWLLMMSV